jgi:hypothetical protein
MFLYECVIVRSSVVRSWYFCQDLVFYKFLTFNATFSFSNVSRLNEDGMTPLDVALLLGDTPVARVLQHHGAVESMKCE